ncbi:MAG: PAS domain-containing protein, partial [Aliihoeflea sp.]
MTKNKRAAVIAVLTMVCAMLAALTVIDRRSAAMFRQDLEVYTHHVTSVLHDRIAARIQHDITTLRSLAHSSTVTSQDPAERFDAFAEYHLGQTDHFISIGFAPDFQLQKLYPSQWVSDFPREKIREMIETRLATLVQSGAAASLNEAPVVETSADGTMMLIVPLKTAAGTQAASGHGAIVLVIDRARFLESANAHPDSALAQDPHGMTFAIRDKQADQPIAGSQSVADGQPVVKTLSLPGSEWEIMATPQQGWDGTQTAQSSFRTTLGIAALSMLLPIFVAGVLLSERNKNIEALRARESKLLDISQRFKLAMDSSNIGIWEIKAGVSGCYLDERSAGLHGFLMQEKTLSLTEWLTAIVPDDRAKAEVFFFNCTCGTQTYSEVYRIAKPDGTVRYLRSAGANYEKSGGERQTTGIIWDVTADMMMAQTLRESKDNSDVKNAELELALDELSSREHELEELSGRLTLALESYNCGIWEAAHDYSSAVWNERMCELYGLPPLPARHVTREDYLNCLHPDERPIALVNERKERDDPARVSTQRVVLADGSIRYVKAVGRL